MYLMLLACSVPTFLISNKKNSFRSKAAAKRLKKFFHTVRFISKLRPWVSLSFSSCTCMCILYFICAEIHVMFMFCSRPVHLFSSTWTMYAIVCWTCIYINLYPNLCSSAFWCRYNHYVWSIDRCIYLYARH